MSADLVIIGLGANLGHSLNQLRKALSELRKSNLFRVLKVSSIYESDAQVPEGAPSDWNKSYLNAAVLCEVASTADPVQLLAVLKNIEISMGRANNQTWAPRLIDLDILYWAGKTIANDGLNIPHPRLSERPFALLPLLEVLPSAHVQRPSWAEPWVSEKPFQTRKSLKYFWPRFVGIVNLTEDSFSDGGVLSSEERLQKQLLRLVSHGAEILDFGAESTRPLATPVPAEQEFEKLKWALKVFEGLKVSAEISIDSYKEDVQKKCLEKFSVSYINDVKGLKDPGMLKLVRDSGKKCFVMHSLSVPPKVDEFINANIDPCVTLTAWWNEKLASGLEPSQLIFDPGIGFGKSKTQSHYILNNLEKFSEIKSDILIGHSRKSFLTLFSERPARERDLETALVTKNLNLAFVQYLRIHDVEAQALAIRSNI